MANPILPNSSSDDQNASPHRRYELTLKLGADTWRDLLEALRLIRIDMNSEPTNGTELERDHHKSQIAENWTAHVDVSFDFEMTHQRYYHVLSNRLKALDRLMDEAEAIGGDDESGGVE